MPRAAPSPRLRGEGGMRGVDGRSDVRRSESRRGPLTPPSPRTRGEGDRARRTVIASGSEAIQPGRRGWIASSLALLACGTPLLSRDCAAPIGSLIYFLGHRRMIDAQTFAPGSAHLDLMAGSSRFPD